MDPTVEEGTPRPTALAVGLLLSWSLVIQGSTCPAAGQTPAESPPEPVLGRPSGIVTIERPVELVFVEEETRLHRLPDGRSAVLAILGVAAPREIEERAGDWVRIRVDGQAGWVVASDGRAGPDLAAPPARAFLEKAESPLRPDPERLARAVALLESPTLLEAGAIEIHTDLARPAAQALAESLADALPAAYRKRYGLAVRERDRFALVIYRRERSYREFERAESGLEDLETHGHAAGNVALAFAGDRPATGLGPILLHELTHLLNRSAFRTRLPPWLEEGLAEDMSLSRIGAEGRLEPGRLGGGSGETRIADSRGDRVVREVWGAPASLRRLVAAQREDSLPPLPNLLALSGPAMVRPEGRALRYARSAFLLRCLLDDREADRRQGLLTFLGRVADGGPSDGEALLGALETTWPKLERWLDTCIARRSRSLEGVS